MNAERIKAALAAAHSYEKSSLNPSGDPRVLAARRACIVFGLDPSEASVLGRAMLLTEAEQVFLVSIPVVNE